MSMLLDQKAVNDSGGGDGEENISITEGHLRSRLSSKPLLLTTVNKLKLVLAVFCGVAFSWCCYFQVVQSLDL